MSLWQGQKCHFLLLSVVLMGFALPSSFAKTELKSCHVFLNDTATDDSELSATERLIAYLRYLHTAMVLSTDDIKQFSDAIREKQILINPLGKKIGTQSSAEVHAENLSHYIQLADQLDLQKILAWSENLLKSQQQLVEHKTKAQDETLSTIQQIRFHPITFLRKRHWTQFYKKPIENKIEVMETPVTQAMWLEVMGDVTFGTKNDFASNPNHPVVYITWWAAAEFANRLSKLHGLKEFYDFSALEKPLDVNAANGSLSFCDSVYASDAITKVRFSAPNGDIYQAEGYRLPTELEQKFLLSGGQLDANVHPNLTKENIFEYAWIRKVPGQHMDLHPVAELSSLLIQGKPFYDLYGNVTELNNNLFYSGHRQLCGLSGGDSAKGLVFRHLETLTELRAHEVYKREDNIGFRLVRSLQK